jgi:hypothetical protein
MSTASKTISKGSGKPASKLTELCTKQLWKQSIEAGKAKELVAALKACPEGQAALKAAAPLPVDCIVVNRSGDDGINEGFCAFIRRNHKTEYLFELLRHHSDDTMHLLGAVDITWETEEEMGDWVNDIVGEMSLDEQKRFFKLAMDIRIPKRDEDGDEIDDACEYLVNQGEEWHETVCQKIRDLLLETNHPTADEDSLVIDVNEMADYQNARNPMKPHAVFTINEQGW